MSSRSIFWEGRPVSFAPGDSVAIALLREGIVEFGRAANGRTGGMFCGIGQCQACLVIAGDRAATEACLLDCENGMHLGPVETNQKKDANV